MASNYFFIFYPLLVFNFKSNFTKHLLIINTSCALHSSNSPHFLNYIPNSLFSFNPSFHSKPTNSKPSKQTIMKLFPRFTLLLHLLIITIIASFLLHPSSQDPNDQSCLTNLFSSITDPNHNLMNWTKPTFTNPCSGFQSNLAGATCNNGRIYKLSLSNLNLHGSISPFISNCTNLQSLDLSNNSLTGNIPNELQYLVNLAVLNLSSNRLSGTISPSIAMCIYLNVIDLHDNVLSGVIPPQVGSLARLSAFDVSNNKLSGMIPTSLGNRTVRFNVSSYMGNKDLYGYPLGPMKNKQGLSVVVIVGIGLGSGLLSLVLSFSVVCVWLRVSDRKMAAIQEGKSVTQSMPEY